MTFNYQNDIDSKTENYPLKLHNTLTYITAKFGEENYEYIILLPTGAIDTAFFEFRKYYFKMLSNQSFS